MQHTQSADELTPVLVEPNGSGGSTVWLRRNIATVEVEAGDGLSQTMWEADEASGTVAGTPTAAELEAGFDSLWEAFERAAMTDGERMDEVRAMAERAMAQADFTALMTDTEV